MGIVAIIGAGIAVPVSRCGASTATRGSRDGPGRLASRAIFRLPPRALGEGVGAANVSAFAPGTRRSLLGTLYLGHGTSIAGITELAGYRWHGAANDTVVMSRYYKRIAWEQAGRTVTYLYSHYNCLGSAYL